MTWRFFATAFGVLLAVAAAAPAPVAAETASTNPTMVLQDGHANKVSVLKFDSRTQLLASGSDDNTAKLWTTDGRLLRTIRGSTWPITDIAFAPTGRRIAAGTFDGRVMLADDESGTVRLCEFTPRSADQVLVRFLPDGRSLLVTRRERSAFLIDLGCNVLKTFPLLTKDILSSDTSPDGMTFALGYLSGRIEILDFQGKQIRSWTGTPQPIKGLRFAPDGKELAAIVGAYPRGGESSVLLWDSQGRPTGTIGPFPQWVEDAGFSANRREVLVVSADVWLYNRDGHRKLIAHGRQYEGSGKGSDACSAAFVDEGRSIAVGRDNGAIEVYARDGLKLRDLASPFPRLTAATMSRNGRFLATAYYRGEKIALWNRNGGLQQEIPSTGNALVFSPDESKLAYGAGGTIRVYSIDGRTTTCFSDCVPLIKSLGPSISETIPVGAVDFNLDGSILASGDWDGNVMLWRPDGTQLKTWHEKLHGGVRGISFAPNGKTLAVRGLDAALWRRIDGTQVSDEEVGARPPFEFEDEGFIFHPAKRYGRYSLLLRGPEAIISDIGSGDRASLVRKGAEWAIFTPDGYFDASRLGGSLVAIRQGNQVFGVDQFAARNNRPDIILERLGLGDAASIASFHAQYLRRLEKLHIEEKTLSSELHAPTAEIGSKRMAGKTLEAELRFSDSQFPLKSFNVYVNDVPLYGPVGKALTGRTARVLERIQLSSGRNKIEVSAMNAKGAESVRALEYAVNPATSPKRLFYLGFGVSRYRDKSLNIRFADKDAKDLERAFSAMSSSFAAIKSKVLLNEEVTVDGIRRAKDFFKDAGVDDTAVVFIAGHGVHDSDPGRTYYLLTHDADVDRLSSTAADFDLIESLLREIRPRNKLLLLDTCESGEESGPAEASRLASARQRGLRPRRARDVFLRIRARRPGPLVSPFAYDRYIMNDLRRRSGAIVFSSSMGTEASFERDEYQNGIFTKAILESLRAAAADIDGNRLISTSEMRKFVAGFVERESEGLQHPVVDRDNIYQAMEFPLQTAP